MTKSKRKTIKDVDLIATVHSLDKLQFLRIDFPRIATTKPVSSDSKVSHTSANAASSVASVVNNGGGKVVATGPGSIKSFFSTSAAAITTTATARSESTDSTTRLDVGEDGDGSDEGADEVEE